MDNYFKPDELEKAMKHAHEIRSIAVHDSLRVGHRRLSELFHLYNPQKRFRR